MRTLYLRPGLVNRFGNQCCVLHVTRLLREVVLEIVAAGALRKRTTTSGRCAMSSLIACTKRLHCLPW